ncbi:MAG: MBL fold metallo-hydrolase, partial [Ornithinimicrobium sp.]
CSALPGGQVEWLDGAPGAWSLALLTVASLLCGPWLIAQLRLRPRVAAGVAMLLVAALTPLPVPSRWPPPPGWTLVACDVGQGDAFVVPTGTRSGAVMVDVGPPRSGVVACLQDLGVERVEALVLSHFHRDHVGGLGEVLAALDVQAAYVTPLRDPPAEARQTLRMLHEAGVPTRAVVARTRLHWPAGEATVIWPESDPMVLGTSAANNASLVLEVTTGSTRVLFTGDIEEEASARVRRTLAGRRFDVLKVAHHGSADQDEALVRGTGADLALIGVGAENPFGHPTTGALAILRGAGMRIRRTDVHGHIAVVPTQRGLSVLSASDP